MLIEIVSIQILRDKYSADHLTLNTKLPAACYPYEDAETLSMRCAAKKGEEYCAKNFPGVPVRVVDIS